MRTLTTAMTNATAATVRLPGYFVEIGFTSPLRMSSRGQITWNSLTWLAYDVTIQSLVVNSSTSDIDATLVIGNADMSLGVSIMNYGIVDRTLKIWAYYGDTPALADPVLMFDGRVSAFDVASDVSVRLQCSTQASVLYCPRTYLDAAAGFNYLPANNQYIWFHAERYQLVAEV